MKSHRKAVVGPVRRLARCIRVLGPVTGWRYWKLQNACLKDLGLAIRIAEESERLAKVYRAQAAKANDVDWFKTSTTTAELYESWAVLTRRCHSEFTKNAEVCRPNGATKS
jgi:hypothetical protein